MNEEIKEKIKAYYIEKDIDEILDYITNLQQRVEQLENIIKEEIDRLNNIINGMEMFFKHAYDNEVKPLNDRKISVWTICLDKLKELKEK